ncbi:hypothetical protein HanRHA438_Chr14g0630661 [Helianthus annuus]|nr:hypothetical protein HanRHA438_Chr14g0630661 [Helianthus annuus]
MCLCDFMLCLTYDLLLLTHLNSFHFTHKRMQALYLLLNYVIHVTCYNYVMMSTYVLHIYHFNIPYETYKILIYNFRISLNFQNISLHFP